MFNITAAPSAGHGLLSDNGFTINLHFGIKIISAAAFYAPVTIKSQAHDIKGQTINSSPTSTTLAQTDFVLLLETIFKHE